MSASPYSKADPAMLAEIVRLAEARLAAQLTLGIAADQRAMTFASFAAAVDAALIAAAVTLHRCPWSLVVLIVGFGIASLTAVFAAQPVAWAIPGWRPAHWLEDIEDGSKLHDSQAEVVGFYERSLVDNDNAMKANANLLRISLMSVTVSLICAAVVALVWG